MDRMYNTMWTHNHMENSQLLMTAMMNRVNETKKRQSELNYLAN